MDHFLNKDFIYLFLERCERREKGGEKHRCGGETSMGCLSHTPNQYGQNLQPRHVP